MKKPINYWMEMFDPKELIPLIRVLREAGYLFEEVFLPFYLSSIWDLKVIIVGDEPPIDPDLNSLIPFGEDLEDMDMSPELKIIKESLPEPITNNRFDASMINWLDQGVMTLYAALTVRPFEPYSHMDLWEPAMKSFFYNISRRVKSLVFVFLGEHASKFADLIDMNGCHTVIHDLNPKEIVNQNSDYRYNFFHYIDWILERDHDTIDWYY